MSPLSAEGDIELSMAVKWWIFRQEMLARLTGARGPETRRRI